jgi:segregation and condensation protein B
LAQLAALFTADALEWKAEQEAASASESPGTPEIAASQPFLVEQLSYPELDEDATASGPAAAATAESSAESVSISDNPANPEAGAGPEAAAEAELEARRKARLRDREARAVIAQLLDELIDDCVSDERGIEIRQIAGGYRMATKPECHDAVRSFVKSLKPPLKLSLPALETLAVIAYKQPVTAPEVNEIRGVDSSAVFGSLLARKFITTAGRKPVIGRPILYKTTREFLLRFGLKDVSELPSMEEFEKLAAIELDEPELSPGAEAAPSRAADLSLELDETATEELTGDYQGAPTETP